MQALGHFTIQLKKRMDAEETHRNWKETEGFWKDLTTCGRPVEVRVSFYNFMAFCWLTCFFPFLFFKDLFTWHSGTRL